MLDAVIFLLQFAIDFFDVIQRSLIALYHVIIFNFQSSCRVLSSLLNANVRLVSGPEVGFL